MERNLLLERKESVGVFKSTLLGWYLSNGRHFPWRKKKISNYQLVVSEILLQRTKAETVSRFFGQFFSRFSSWKELANSNEAEIEKMICPIGLSKQRSSTLKKLAEVMVGKNGRFPRDREQIEALPGVGQYITNAILLLCHGEAQPLLDVNMARVLERVFGPRKLADIRYDPYLQHLAWKVVQGEHPKELNWAILDFAATICLKKTPHCNECSLRSICLAVTSQRICPSKIDQLPVNSEPRKINCDDTF